MLYKAAAGPSPLYHLYMTPRCCEVMGCTLMLLMMPASHGAHCCLVSWMQQPAGETNATMLTNEDSGRIQGTSGGHDAALRRLHMGHRQVKDVAVWSF